MRGTYCNVLRQRRSGGAFFTLLSLFSPSVARTAYYSMIACLHYNWCESWALTIIVGVEVVERLLRRLPLLRIALGLQFVRLSYCRRDHNGESGAEGMYVGIVLYCTCIRVHECVYECVHA